MYNVSKEIHSLNNLCISSDEKEQRIRELEQLNYSIAYTSTVLHFFWNEDIMVSYKRDERYTIIDMLGKLLLIFCIILRFFGLCAGSILILDFELGIDEQTS